MAGETVTLNAAIDATIAKCASARNALGHGSVHSPNNSVLDDTLSELSVLLAALKVWSTLTGA